VLNKDYDRVRGPSLAAQRRAREKARMAADGPKETTKQSREVVVPETITVQELSNRMAEAGGDVVKSLMKMGVMATINQVIDVDTAELIIDEFGHKIKRVSESDVEDTLGTLLVEENEENLQPRPPVVTIMGHVDHGKTSLLDALRETNVVSGEAGGITQHIGAYQVTLESGEKITFLDTPGHAAFTQMRARGANITDIVIIVVAANDSIMPQTIEAINHAKAAEVPLIIAINKVDLPDADTRKVKNDLLQHEVVVEEMGGDIICVEVSALKRQNLDKLEEMILLQAEVLELKTNPDRAAVGTVIEAKMEQGRGNVATVLIQRGTLKIGDIFVIGSEWGKVRALFNDKGKKVKHAIPGQPVEVLGLNGAPEAGDQFVVLDDESEAREISEYRQRKKREASSFMLGSPGASFEQLLAASKEADEKQWLNVVIKADVHGSVEAIIGSLQKIEKENEDIGIRVLHSGVGGITESDVILANASSALIVGFNVRANAQARELAERETADIRYYNVIYNVIDDAKAILGGLLAPTEREEYLGQAEIRQVFRVTKVGNVAGCMVTRGMVKRGSRVRLLRDDVVIHEGTLKTLKRFKDEAKEVNEGMECGMAFEGYDDIKEKDIIECYDVTEEARVVE
jgi:translation initiation factor IF-2